MVSSAMFFNPPAFSSTAALDGLKRTGSMRRACCACLRPISGVITKPGSMVRVPTPKRRMPSARTASATSWCRKRLRIENRIEALLFTQGHSEKTLSSFLGARSCCPAAPADGREIPRHLRAELDRLRRRLVMTLELIREVEAERDQAAKTKPQDRACHKIAALSRIRGIGQQLRRRAHA